MRLLLVGCGGVGEIIARVLADRSDQSDWLEALIIADYDHVKVKKVFDSMKDYDLEVKGLTVDAADKETVKRILKEYNCNCLFDASPPYLANQLFDAAFEAKVDFLNMGTWSVPSNDTENMTDAKSVYTEFMTDYNFDRDKDWVKIGKTAIICVGIDPGVVNVFSKFAAKHLFDTIKEIHVKDGCNITLRDGGDDIAFGFNVWTVLDECLNPSVTWSKEDGYTGHRAFAGEEIFYFPEGIGPLKLYQIEHEEVVLIPKYLEEYGLEKCTYKIALDDELIKALNMIDKLGLRSLDNIDYKGIKVKPRDIIAKVLPQPHNIDYRYEGKMCVGIHCIGIKNGLSREVFLYQTYDQVLAWSKYESQAVVVQTAIGASIAIELLGKGKWVMPGVNGPEAFDPEDFIMLMKEYEYSYDMVEMNSEYSKANSSNLIEQHLIN